MENPSATRLLASNVPPSKADIGSLNTSITQLENRVARIDKEISQLVVRKEELAARKDTYHGILSPIRRLNSEILSEIFHAAIRQCKNSSPRMNLVLLRVCQSWREVILKSPTLWTSLAVPPHVKAKHIRAVAEGITECMRRSRALPLSIAFDTPNLSREAAADLFSFIPAKQRWRELTVTMRYVEFFNSTVKSQESAFKMLQHVAVQDKVEDQHVLELNFRLDLMTLLNLTSVSVQTMHHFTHESIALPHLQLTHLAVEALSNTGDYLELLRNFPNLQKCDFAIHARGEPNCGVVINAASPPVVAFCPNLLQFRLGSADYLISLLVFVVAPNLQDLTIASNGQDSGDAIAADMGIDQELLYFLKTSRCLIKKLELDNVALARSEFTPLLESLPGLQELVIRTSQVHMRNYLDNAVINRLKELAQKNPILGTGLGGVLPRLNALRAAVPTGKVAKKAFLGFACSHPKISQASLEYLSEPNDQDLDVEHYESTAEKRITVTLPPLPDSE